MKPTFIALLALCLCVVVVGADEKPLIAIPNEDVVQKLERIADKLEKPIKVFPTFRRTVITVGPDDTLARIFTLISKNDYSQFPVYNGNLFKGLLTENGITRRLANHVADEMSLIDLEDVKVGAVLPQEEKRKNWDFVTRERLLEEVRHLFFKNKELEAVLITQNGKPIEKPLGIVTRWDLIRH